MRYVVREKECGKRRGHVPKNRGEIPVLLPNAREFLAKLIGTDPQTDIALIGRSHPDDFAPTPVRFAREQPVHLRRRR